MISFLNYRARRFFHHGWGLLHPNAKNVAPWTVCTTREEARKLRDLRPDLLSNSKPVKVRIIVEVIEGQ